MMIKGLQFAIYPKSIFPLMILNVFTKKYLKTTSENAM